jgi:hypothetical protein
MVIIQGLLGVAAVEHDEGEVGLADTSTLGRHLEAAPAAPGGHALSES